MDDEWARFFRDHDFLVGLSVDGPRELHDTYRVDKGGKPTFDRVMRGLRHLREHGVRWNALTTLHDANAARGREIYAFLRDEMRRRPHAVHPDRGTRHPAHPAPRQRRLGRPCQGPAALPAGRRPRHRPLGDRRAVRPIPHRRLRGLGTP
ncbi:hypothetical protein [Streptomyces sp. NRRL WC-3618]|uniref:hypothetical protein n=1 Tax=Streptomyces sp. NRRL WC-3618 TaxID=1519490 RepID=UPI003B635A92